ncbi:MAG: nucleoside-diphosphate sugar epimerase [Planctomycetaceae bacterium]|nr:nucleoside-diphosphate sugar epimerase [Planctomycetaceae bacterium]MBP60637.1 nucleoside-diphosphate sugar epimerase [Planctomycetaceae bacterium]
MKTLVTGGAGFIGSHLTEALLERGDEVVVIDDTSTGSFENLASVMSHPRLTCIHQSVKDVDLAAQVLAEMTEVYHLAAAVGVALIAEQPIQSIKRNIYPTQLLLDELVRLNQEDGKQRRFFLASSSEVYGKNPRPRWVEDDDLVFGSTSRARWSYGVSKAIDEFLALACFREHDLPLVIGRFFNVVGPRQTGAYGMVLPRFIEAALGGHPVIVHDDGQQERCFAHVSDVVRAVTTLMATPSAYGQVFNVGSDVPVSILELARRVVVMANSASNIDFQSYCDAYGSDFEDIRRRVPDLSRLKSTIHFQPQYKLDDVIQELIESRKIDTNP